MIKQEEKPEKLDISFLPQGFIHPKSQYILGMDVARTGADESAFVVLEKNQFSPNIFICYLETLKTPDLKSAINRVIFLNKFFNFKKIIIDETGLGAGVSDVLKGEIGNKVEGIWYTLKSKAELFNNLKLLMIRKEGRLFIPDYNISSNAMVRKLYYQFLSIHQDMKDGMSTPKFSHDEKQHDDLVNALALAASYFDVRKRLRKIYGLVGIKGR